MIGYILQILKLISDSLDTIGKVADAVFDVDYIVVLILDRLGNGMGGGA